jgi:hypothetical protein
MTRTEKDQPHTFQAGQDRVEYTDGINLGE